MRLPFVNRKRYEEVIKHCEFVEKQVNYLSKEYGKLKGVREKLINSEDMNAAYKKHIDDLWLTIAGFKEKEEHYKRSIAAYKFQSSRRKKKMDELQTINSNSIKSLKELDELNVNILERVRKLEKENLDYQENIKKLSDELNAIKRKPTVEELKYENCLVEHNKLAGRRKTKK